MTLQSSALGRVTGGHSESCVYSFLIIIQHKVLLEVHIISKLFCFIYINIYISIYMFIYKNIYNITMVKKFYIYKHIYGYLYIYLYITNI